MVSFHSIRSRLTFAYIASVLICISALGYCLSRWTENHYTASLRSELESESRFLGTLCEERSSVDALARQAGTRLGRRVTIIGGDGTVLGDSHHDSSTMECHDTRPEVRQAIESGFGWSVRESDTLHVGMLYVATRFGQREDGTLGVARVAESLSQVSQVRSTIHRAFFVAALIVFCVLALVGAKVSEGVAGPILTMNAIARRFGQGDLSGRIRVRGRPGDETDELASALNHMAGELGRTMGELAAEKGKLQAIVDKTDDGLIVVDHESRVQMANPAAIRLLTSESAQIVGRTIIESTLSHDLSELVKMVLLSREPATLEIKLAVPEETHLNVYVTPLGKPDGSPGALVVMHDLSTARRIDAVRRDFVANFSHELRTPLAAIRAMAETITMRGRNNPHVVEDFAGKIVAETDRLAALSEDMLDLARIEAGRRTISSEAFPLSVLVAQTTADLGRKAESRGVVLSSAVPDELRVNADRDAVRQILSNLLDNAIKYTPAGGSVAVSAEQGDEWVSVVVADTGIGIPQSDLSRVFERFYRVDRARSRESGGTGLGLSIVKHLIEVHGGMVTVESSPGRGSSFAFTLPAA